MDLVVLTNLAVVGAPATVLPSLELLPHRTRCCRPDVETLMANPQVQAVLVDARADLAEARGVCRMLRTTGVKAALIAVVTESGLAAVHSDWEIDDVILCGAGPAEVEARLRLAAGRNAVEVDAGAAKIRAGDLTIDPDTYAAKLKGRPLDLTYKEFELLRYLAQHPGRVYSREQLLREVWGFDYFGGTRTVDVHVRRLRAKLGSDNETMIGTVRQVGYKFAVPAPKPLSPDSTEPAHAKQS